MGGRRFQKGQSGNPAGKPKGCRNKVTRAMEKLLEADAKTITAKAIELAKAGDGPALRLCLERIIAPRKDRPISFPLPKLEDAADAAKAQAAITKAVSEGELTPSEGAEMAQLVSGFLRAFEVTEIEARLRKLEQEAP